MQYPNPACPGFKGPETALLLTDGSVIMHDTCTPNFRLLPANTGNFCQQLYQRAVERDGDQ